MGKDKIYKTGKKSESGLQRKETQGRQAKVV